MCLCTVHVTYIVYDVFLSVGVLAIPRAGKKKGRCELNECTAKLSMRQDFFVVYKLYNARLTASACTFHLEVSIQLHNEYALCEWKTMSTGQTPLVQLVFGITSCH